MANLLIKIAFFVFLPLTSFCQHTFPDSLRQELLKAGTDSIRFEINRQLYTYYEEINRDSAVHYSEIRLQIARKNNRKIEEAFATTQKGYQLVYLGRFGEALDCLQRSLAIAENRDNEVQHTWILTNYMSPGNSRLLTLSMTHHMLGHLMMQTGNTDRQFYHLKEGRRIAVDIDNKFRIVVADMVLGSSYISANKPDSALIYVSEAEKIALEAGINKYLGYIYFVLGDIQLQKGNQPLAKQYYLNSIHSSAEQNNLTNLVGGYVRLINFHRGINNKDSVLSYALENLKTVRSLGAVTAAATHYINIGTAYEQVYLGYKMLNRPDSAFRYLELAANAKDSLAGIRIKNLSDFQNLSFSEQQRLQNIEREKADFQNRIRMWLLIAGILVAGIIAFLLYRNFRNSRKANAVLQKQKEELQAALTELKSTQALLIQSEKMASLGELTAGIAHEIQNPLNFVNNFSEVNKELLAEMNDEMVKGNFEEVKLIAKDITDNEEKINHHGKRADSIVKAMLQHSRTSSGQKEFTDLNALADEYLRLAYHGLKAKDKSFNAAFKFIPDPLLPKVNVVPQDIGRVLLNLINNAFQAVKGYGEKPTVTVTTRKRNDTVEIIVADNGPGIPESIRDKIFQPFFTTKPTGQGTGLGLSLSYDIVKAHGGELKVKTKENDGSELIISLPVN